MQSSLSRLLLMLTLSQVIFSCTNSSTTPSNEAISAMSLKSGAYISCGPEDKKLGSVNFLVSGSEKIKEDFNLGVKLLHSFEYDEAEKVFANIIQEDPKCAMAYWGVAMSNFHPLWTPPTVPELEKGAKAVNIAASLKNISKREQDYIQAVSAFYQDWNTADHRSRCNRFEKAMESLHADYPQDKEAAAFYALALNAAADPADKTFAKQKKAGAILTTLYPGEPNHPGIVHYIIHTFDSPELAALALPAARKYASIAPASAHALHMPSHIFTRLGLWNESIQSNIASVESAKCYAEAAGIKGHWDEELHGMDYLVYGYLQTGQNELAKKQFDYLKSIDQVNPANFKVSYAFASIPSRYLLENRMWKEAADLQDIHANFTWEAFPWQHAIIYFTRALGAVHTGNLVAAKAEWKSLNSLHYTLTQQKDTYKANQVAIQMKATEAWLAFKEGKNKEAIALMRLAAEMEDNTEKHPVTAGEVLPARELLGDLLMEMNESGKALQAYEVNLKKHPNRFNALYGAGLAAEKTGNSEKANVYYRQLLSIAGSGKPERPELLAIHDFFKIQGNKVMAQLEK